MKCKSTKFREYISHQERRYIVNVIKLSSITFGLVSLRSVSRNPKYKISRKSVRVFGRTDRRDSANSHFLQLFYECASKQWSTLLRPLQNGTKLWKGLFCVRVN